MTRSRTFARIAMVVLVGILIALALPTPPAFAAEPPFEVVFPQRADVTVHHDDYGARRSGGRSHRGNDLMAPKLSPVYAVADGFVDRVASSSRAGRYLIIRHASGWASWYLHLNNDRPNTDDGSAPWSVTIAPGIKEGVFVEAGQLIGYVGDSGNAEWTGSHTHFELEQDGLSVDPGPYLAAAQNRALEALFVKKRYYDHEETYSTI